MCLCHIVTELIVYITVMNVSCFFMQEKKRKYEPPVPTRVGKRKKKSKGPDAATKLPQGEMAVFIAENLH